jgi:hypothetical protein
LARRVGLIENANSHEHVVIAKSSALRRPSEDCRSLCPRQWVTDPRSWDRSIWYGDHESMFELPVVTRHFEFPRLFIKNVCANNSTWLHHGIRKFKPPTPPFSDPKCPTPSIGFNLPARRVRPLSGYAHLVRSDWPHRQRIKAEHKAAEA